MVNLSNMSSYVNSQIGISILIPQQWTVEVVTPVQCRILGLPEPGFEEYFDEYRSTMSYILATPENLENNWFETLIDQANLEMLKEYNEYQLVREENCQILDRSAYVKYYEWTDENTSLRLSQLQAMIQADSSSFYLINAATIKTIANKYIPIFDKILKSTKIISRVII